jgi:hypothetical protein
LVTRQMGRGRVKQGAARGVVRCCGTKGAFYRLGEAVEGREAAGGGGFLIPVGFNIESGRGVDEALS